MKLDNAKIRASLDSRLSALEADPARRARIRRRIYEAEEPVMKRKFKTSVALAAVLMLILVGTAVAVGINLFEYFGSTNERYKEIAPQTELKNRRTAVISTEELGVTTASFNSAYYDGQSMLVSYTIENDERTERIDAAAVQFAGMEKMRGIPGWDAPTVPAQFREEFEAGKTFAYVTYSIHSDATFVVGDGIELSSWQSENTEAPEGTYSLVEFRDTLPEAAQNRDSLEIRMKLILESTCVYFDGQDLYKSVDIREVGEVSAVASRADAQTRIYAGDGSYNGIPVHIRAEVSAVSAAVTVTAEGEAFPQLAEDDIWYDVNALEERGVDIWYDLYLLDERGVPLAIQELGVQTDAMDARFEGTGKLPEQISAYVIVCWEGEWTYEELMEATEPIILTPQD